MDEDQYSLFIILKVWKRLIIRRFHVKSSVKYQYLSSFFAEEVSFCSLGCKFWICRLSQTKKLTTQENVKIETGIRESQEAIDDFINKQKKSKQII